MQGAYSKVGASCPNLASFGVRNCDGGGSGRATKTFARGVLCRRLPSTEFGCLHMGLSINGGTQNGWFIRGKKHLNMDDLGVAISGNLHMNLFLVPRKLCLTHALHNEHIWQLARTGTSFKGCPWTQGGSQGSQRLCGWEQASKVSLQIMVQLFVPLCHPIMYAILWCSQAG